MTKPAIAKPQLDHDGDGKPGGSLPRPHHAVLTEDHPLGGRFAAGAVVAGPADAIAALVEAKAARKATDQEVLLAGHQLLTLPSQEA